MKDTHLKYLSPFSWDQKLEEKDIGVKNILKNMEYEKTLRDQVLMRLQVPSTWSSMPQVWVQESTSPKRCQVPSTQCSTCMFKSENQPLQKYGGKAVYQQASLDSTEFGVLCIGYNLFFNTRRTWREKERQCENCLPYYSTLVTITKTCFANFPKKTQNKKPKTKEIIWHFPFQVLFFHPITADLTRF